jgi:hypothetical protein
MIDLPYEDESVTKKIKRALKVKIDLKVSESTPQLDGSTQNTENRLPTIAQPSRNMLA